MKHFILILLMCSVVTTVEARDKWKPKYNEELIQMYEENEKLKEDMAAEYWKAVKKELKELLEMKNQKVGPFNIKTIKMYEKKYKELVKNKKNI